MRGIFEGAGVSCYHDRIIKRPGMLDTIKRYMADNPLRALMRRALPALLERRRFEACARGTLLILSPWGIEDQLPTDYQRFHFLNDLATEICNTTDATIVDIQGIMKG